MARCHGRERVFSSYRKDGIVLRCLILCSLTHRHVLSAKINIPVACSRTDYVTLGYFRMGARHDIPNSVRKIVNKKRPLFTPLFVLLSMYNFCATNVN
jgi:hypothetical protein